MKIRWENKWITTYVVSVTWFGSATQCSRSLDISIVNNPNNKEFYQLNIKLGDLLYLYEGSTRLFVGEVTTLERTGDDGSISIKAMDVMSHLLRSKTSRNFRNTSPEKITQAVCSEIGIKTKNLEKTGVNIPKFYPREEALYNIILGAYGKVVRETKKKYMATVDGILLTVIEKGLDSGVILNQSQNITSSQYGETMEQMINQVVIYNDKGQKTGIVKEDDWVKKYGIFQEAYVKESGVNSRTAAEALFCGIEKTASVEALGDIRAVSGKAIQIKDKITGLTGKFWIETDSHSWSDGKHVMSLDLAFKNIMETISVSSEEKKGNGGAGKSQNDKINKVTELAKSYIGKVKYIMGAASPHSGKSDCSGFTQYCFKKAAGVDIGRTTNNQVQSGEKVNKSQLKIGDLVMFKNTYNSGYSFGVSHVGIYIGQNKFIHCSSSGGVKINSLGENYYVEHWLMGRRVIK